MQLYNTNKIVVDKKNNIFLNRMKDVKKNDWFYKELQYAIQKELINPKKHFYPNQKLTKAELLTILSRDTDVKKQIEEHF